MKFSWQKDDKSIILYPSITVKNSSGNTSTLTLEHSSTTDAGRYTCTASNDAGSVISEPATLQVTGEYNELMSLHAKLTAIAAVTALFHFVHI